MSKDIKTPKDPRPPNVGRQPLPDVQCFLKLRQFATRDMDTFAPVDGEASGTRLCPVSRQAFPKQFASLLGSRSTFQETVLRFAGHPGFGKPLVVTNKDHRFLADRQLKGIGIEADFLLEPVARDSGPAMLASAMFIAQESSGALALVLASDHVVLAPEGFRRAAKAGASAARAGEIVTFGIVPTHPAKGYGYIAAGSAIDESARRVERFVEKPDEARARCLMVTLSCQLLRARRRGSRSSARVRRLAPPTDQTA